MYCGKCHSDVIDCKCDDIDQRLQELANEHPGLVSYAAKQDREARKRKGVITLAIRPERCPECGQRFEWD